MMDSKEKDENGLDLKDAMVIFTMAECNMVVSKVEAAMHVHHRIIANRLEGIQEKTGLDPHNFYDLCQLLIFAEQRFNIGER